MAKRPTVLKVSGLKRAFGPNTILDKFNLEVRAGEAWEPVIFQTLSS